MKALTTNQHRVMFSIPSRDTKQILEAKFKLSPFGYAYGYFHNVHYWSFPAELENQCRNILESVFPKNMISRIN